MNSSMTWTSAIWLTCVAFARGRSRPLQESCGPRRCPSLRTCSRSWALRSELTKTMKRLRFAPLSSIGLSLQDTHASICSFRRGRVIQSTATGIGSTSTLLSSNACGFQRARTLKFMRTLPNVPDSVSQIWSISTWTYGLIRPRFYSKLRFRRLFNAYRLTTTCMNRWFVE